MAEDRAHDPKRKVVTDKEIQAWYDSGPIKPDMLKTALEILSRDKDK